jgi:hypothetical protein
LPRPSIWNHREMSDRERHRPDVPPDPSGIEQPHDVLAAEEFGIGTRDERYPADPMGISEPHDVLAAEEFAMPAGSEEHGGEGGGFAIRTWLPLLAIAALVVAVVVVRRRDYG